MTAPKRGRPRKAPAPVRPGLRVLVAGAIFDGKGGFYAVGDTCHPVDEEAAASLKAKGLAE